MSSSERTVIGAPDSDLIVNGLASLSADIEVTVHHQSGGDYTSITEATAALVRKYPGYSQAKGGSVTANIRCLEGFVMSEQVLYYGLNLGWITIIGDDPETNIDNAAMTTDFEGMGIYPAFAVSRGGVAPRIGHLFSFAGEVVNPSVGLAVVGAGSAGNVLPGAGLKNAGYNALHIDYGGLADVHEADLRNAIAHSIYTRHSSRVNAYGVNASGSDVSVLAAISSTVNADNVNCTHAGVGIYSFYGSPICASGVDCTDCTDVGLKVERAGEIIAYGFNGTTSQDLYVRTENGIIRSWDPVSASSSDSGSGSSSGSA